MDLDFWVSSVRDLVLLALGSGFTLVGTGLANRQAAHENEKARRYQATERALIRDENKLDADRAEDVERGKELLRVVAQFGEYLERGIGDQNGGDQDFPDQLISTADDIAELIHDSQARNAVVGGVWLSYSWDMIAPTGRGFELENSKSAHQWKTLRHLRAMAGALARQDSPPSAETNWLLKNMAELDAAWEDRMAEQEDWRRANAEE